VEIKFSKPARQCLATERLFEHEEPIVSLVRLSEGSLQREDYARAAFEESFAQGAVAVWNAVYYDPKVLQQEPEESYSPLRRIFYEAAGQDDRHQMAVAFLAAQLLRRQRVFRLVKTSDGDEQVQITLFTDRLSERLVEVPDPHLTYAEMEAGREALAQRLAELEAPSEEAGATEQNSGSEDMASVSAPAEGEPRDGAQE